MKKEIHFCPFKPIHGWFQSKWKQRQTDKQTARCQPASHPYLIRNRFRSLHFKPEPFLFYFYLLNLNRPISPSIHFLSFCGVLNNAVPNGYLFSSFRLVQLETRKSSRLQSRVYLNGFREWIEYCFEDQGKQNHISRLGLLPAASKEKWWREKGESRFTFFLSLPVIYEKTGGCIRWNRNWIFIYLATWRAQYIPR